MLLMNLPETFCENEFPKAKNWVIAFILVRNEVYQIYGKVRASNLEHSTVLLPPEVGFDTAHEI